MLATPKVSESQQQVAGKSDCLPQWSERACDRDQIVGRERDGRGLPKSQFCRYCWVQVERRPARPCWSIECCQERNSSTVSVYRLQASSRESRPPRTAATTSALRRTTQRFVPGVGKSAIVNGLPSGPITYCVLGRRGSVTNTLMRLPEITPAQCYAPPPKIFLRASEQLEIGRKSRAA